MTASAPREGTRARAIIITRPTWRVAHRTPSDTRSSSFGPPRRWPDRMATNVSEASARNERSPFSITSPIEKASAIAAHKASTATAAVVSGATTRAATAGQTA